MSNMEPTLWMLIFAQGSPNSAFTQAVIDDDSQMISDQLANTTLSSGVDEYDLSQYQQHHHQSGMPDDMSNLTLVDPADFRKLFANNIIPEGVLLDLFYSLTCEARLIQEAALISRHAQIFRILVHYSTKTPSAVASYEPKCSMSVQLPLKDIATLNTAEPFAKCMTSFIDLSTYAWTPIGGYRNVEDRVKQFAAFIMTLATGCIPNTHHIRCWYTVRDRLEKSFQLLMECGYSQQFAEAVARPIWAWSKDAPNPQEMADILKRQITDMAKRQNPNDNMSIDTATVQSSDVPIPCETGGFEFTFNLGIRGGSGNEPPSGPPAWAQDRRAALGVSESRVGSTTSRSSRPGSRSSGSQTGRDLGDDDWIPNTNFQWPGPIASSSGASQSGQSVASTVRPESSVSSRSYNLNSAVHARTTAYNGLPPLRSSSGASHVSRHSSASTVRPPPRPAQSIAPSIRAPASRSQPQRLADWMTQGSTVSRSSPPRQQAHALSIAGIDDSRPSLPPPGYSEVFGPSSRTGGTRASDRGFLERGLWPDESDDGLRHIPEVSSYHGRSARGFGSRPPVSNIRRLEDYDRNSQIGIEVCNDLARRMAGVALNLPGTDPIERIGGLMNWSRGPSEYAELLGPEGVAFVRRAMEIAGTPDGDRMLNDLAQYDVPNVFRR